jgi:hypothetical protein
MERFSDPTGMSPKILSSGWTMFLRVRVTFAIDGTVLILLKKFLPFRGKPRFPL